MKFCLFFVFSVTITLFGFSQTVVNVDQIQTPDDYENIHVERLFGDSISTSFMIWVKDSVAAHRHNYHSEVVYVLEGTGKMKMNEELYTIKKGDKIFIPKKTWHAVKVKSEVPLRVLSVQSPGFFGEDREFKYLKN